MRCRHLKVIQDEAIAKNTAKAFVVKKGQFMRVYGETPADFVAFNLHNLRERFDQARTKVNHGKIFLSKGDNLITKFNNLMFTITEDAFTDGTHDLQFGTCSRSYYEKWGERLFEIYGEEWAKTGRKPSHFPDRGCWENLTEALKPWGIAMEDIPSEFNIFQSMVIDPRTGKMRFLNVRPKPGTHIDLKAEMDALIAVGVCPAGGSRAERCTFNYSRWSR